MPYCNQAGAAFSVVFFLCGFMSGYQNDIILPLKSYCNKNLRILFVFSSINRNHA